MDRYESYKDSGEQWLGEIPSHWELIRGKALYSENKCKNKESKENIVLSLSYGNIVLKPNTIDGLVPEKYDSYQIVEPNYIIVRCTDLQNDKVSLRTAVSDYHGIITSAYLGLIPNCKIVPKYLHYYLRAWDECKEMYRYGSGLRQSLSWVDFKYLNVALPTKDEQNRMIEYLDDATSKIDEAIAQQQKMIDLLNERKQIIINNAVTKGLNPDIPMKDSGVDWIGEIPEHWVIKKLKYVCSFNDEVLSETTGNIKIKYVEIGDVDFHEGITNHTEYAFIDAPSRARRITRVNDVIISTVRTYLKAIAKIEEDNLVVSTGFAVLRAKEINSSYLSYALMNESFVSEVLASSTGVSYPAITASSLSSIPIAIPPIEEQIVISNYLFQKCSIINSNINIHKQQILLLQERKQIIINEVVTGKVKV